METIEQHVERLLGTPWLQGSDHPDNGGLDCFGGCTYMHLCVKGKPLPTPPWRVECETDKALTEALEKGDYVEAEAPKDLDVFVCFDKNGVAVHCGLYVRGYAYHITGSVEKEGYASLWEFNMINRVYGAIKYYRVVG